MKLIDREDAKASLDMKTGKIRMEGLFNAEDFTTIANQCQKIVDDFNKCTIEAN